MLISTSNTNMIYKSVRGTVGMVLGVIFVGLTLGSALDLMRYLFGSILTVHNIPIAVSSLIFLFS